MSTWLVGEFKNSTFKLCGNGIGGDGGSSYSFVGYRGS